MGSAVLRNGQANNNNPGEQPSENDQISEAGFSQRPVLYVENMDHP